MSVLKAHPPLGHDNATVEPQQRISIIYIYLYVSDQSVFIGSKLQTTFMVPELYCRGRLDLAVLFAHLHCKQSEPNVTIFLTHMRNLCNGCYANAYQYL